MVYVEETSKTVTHKVMHISLFRLSPSSRDRLTLITTIHLFSMWRDRYLEGRDFRVVRDIYFRALSFFFDDITLLVGRLPAGGRSYRVGWEDIYTWHCFFTWEDRAIERVQGWVGGYICIHCFPVRIRAT